MAARSSAHYGARLVGFIEYVFRRSDKLGDIYPQDSPDGIEAGPDPYRIVVLGESNAVGLGVTSHRLGMAGHLARKIAAQSGRGVEWSALHVPGNRVGRVTSAIDGNGQRWAATDLVVLMLGIVDTLSLQSASSWRRELAVALDHLVSALPIDGRILVTAIPPMDNAGSISAFARRAAGFQARALNRVTAELVATRPQCAMVPFPTQMTEQLWVPESRETPYVKMYASWAAAAAAATVAVEL